MHPFLYTAGKGFAIFTGFTLFAHSRLMPSTLKTYFDPHPFFKKNLEFKNDEELFP